MARVTRNAPASAGATDPVAEKHLRRYAALETELRLWYPIWQDIADYLQPRKSNLLTERTPGQSQTDLLFDSTGEHANQLLAASMQGALTSDSMPWINLVIKNLELTPEDELYAALRACTETMNADVQASNFSSESHELYLDIGSFGIGCVFVDEKDPLPGQPFGGLRLEALPPGSYAIAEDPDGFVDTLYRVLKMSLRTAAAKFGEDALSEQSRARLLARPDETVRILHGVLPRDDHARMLRKGPGRVRGVDKAWASIWIEMDAKRRVREHGFDEFPFMVPRWTKTSGETYGRGPGHTALPDLRTLNKGVEFKLSAWALAVKPPYVVRDEGVLGAVRVKPAGLIHVRDMDAIRALDERAKFDVADIQEDKIRERIRRIFFSDQLQLQDGPQMTATEVNVRYELMQRILGPTLGRLKVEWLNRFVERVFAMRLRSEGRRGGPFSEVVRLATAANVVMDVEYESPLAQAQRLAESAKLTRFLQTALPIVQMDETAMDALNAEEMLRVHAKATGLPPRVLRSAEDIAEIREARNAAAQAKQQQDQLQQMAQTAGQAAPMIDALTKAQTAGALPQQGIQLARP
jgi:hypothetical protein